MKKNRQGITTKDKIIVYSGLSLVLVALGVWVFYKRKKNK
jgi:LPXTG-motif cell wall-anchored protein